MPKYSFDLTLLTAVTVQAPTLEQARKIIRDTFDCADCNGGLWPNGQPVLFEASIEGDADLYEIDGEPA